MNRLSNIHLAYQLAGHMIAVVGFILAFPPVVQIGLTQVQEPGSSPGAVTGPRELRFTERDPQSSIREQAKRFNWQVSWVKQQDPDAGEYDLSHEHFRVYVPAGWDSDSPVGLFVWVSPNQSGEVPVEWRRVLDRHKLIAIGAGALN